jgi:orotidine-5'-phosphate decarboxylase
MGSFGERMATAVRATGTCAVVGLDPHLDRLPGELRARYEGKSGTAYFEAAAEAVVDFGRMVIDGVSGLVPAVKPQFAFYEALGAPGWAALTETARMAKEAGLLTIGDAKRGDISSTGAAYARAILDPDGPLGLDSITLNPWMGIDTLDPFLGICAEHGRGVFVLVRTTNPGSALLQHHGSPPAASVVARALNTAGQATLGPSGMSSVGAVVGASAGADAAQMRAQMPAAWFLVPGVGAQGGAAEDAVAGARPDGLGCLVNSSRGVLFGPTEDADPAAAIRSRAKAHAERFALSSINTELS